MSRTTTTVTKCDNCGAIGTTEIEYSHEIPSLSPTNTMGIAMRYMGTPPDYCPVCVGAVRRAIADALAARRAAVAS